MNSKERILQYIDYKQISNRDFCKIISVSSAYFTKKGSIGSDIVEKILLNYPELNADWVITGRGNMLLSGSNEQKDVSITTEPSDWQSKYYALLEKYNSYLEAGQLIKVNSALIEEKTKI